jgi:hypothetical protein
MEDRGVHGRMLLKRMLQTNHDEPIWLTSQLPPAVVLLRGSLSAQSISVNKLLSFCREWDFVNDALCAMLQNVHFVYKINGCAGPSWSTASVLLLDCLVPFSASGCDIYWLVKCLCWKYGCGDNRMLLQTDQTTTADRDACQRPVTCRNQ